MGEPERERDHVVAAAGLPAEDVRRKEPHALILDARTSEREHLRSRVDGGDAARVADQLLGPHAGSARELEHAPGGLEGLQRAHQLLAVPARIACSSYSGPPARY